MLSYGGLDTYDSSNVEKSAEAIITLDLNERAFMLGLSADLKQAVPSISIANHPFYRGWLPLVD
jgi:hypothetical protein